MPKVDKNTQETKAARIRKLLDRKSGATVEKLCTETGWQPHSIRAAMSGLRKAGYTIERRDAPRPGGATSYRIADRPSAQ